MVKFCIISRLYCTQPSFVRTIPIEGTLVDAVFITNENFSALELRTGTPLSEILVTETISPVNFNVGQEYISLLTRVEISEDIEAAFAGTQQFRLAPTLWSMLKDLAEIDAVLVEEDREIPLWNLAASRTTDSVYVRYLTDVGYRTKVLASISDVPSMPDTLRFRGAPGELAAVALRYSKFITPGKGTVLLHINKANLVGLDREDFARVANPTLFVFQQSIIEFYKVCKLAGWFAALVMKELYGVQAVRETPSEPRATSERRVSPMIFDVTTQGPRQAELKGLIYGCAGKFFLNAAKAGLKDPTGFRKYLDEVIPQTTKLFTVFKDEVTSLMKPSDVGYDAAMFADYQDGCNYSLSQQYMQMCDWKCMALEYDYAPAILRQGATLCDVTLTLKRGQQIG